MLILVLLVCLCLTGCQHLQKLFPPRRDALPPSPIPAQPTLEQITSTINANSRSIQNLSTKNASIHTPGLLVPLYATITFERPKRMRIQGFVSTLSGQEFDFGSNDEIFWLWTKNRGAGANEMWFCRHDLYPESPVRSAIAIDPDWLIEAIGMVEFKPTDQHLGPTKMADGNWEIISHCQTPSGQFIKRSVIDAKVGRVMKQELYTPQRELIASAESSDWRVDRGTNIIYAKRISVQCQGMDGKLTIDLGSPTFNSPDPLPSTMFVMQTFEGYRVLDLTSPEFLHPRGIIMPMQITDATGVPVPQAHTQTVIR
ncbi:MAG: hypothetical protein FWE95_01525 [Planctomycetaceae bacterium]|nr:hypothetical protein [Planctomycetaceae bacterium]